MINRYKTHGFLLMAMAVGPLLETHGAEAGRSSAEKSAFNFFNPAPNNLVRDMTTDGPGATESPYTVDAGHFQIEMSFVDYSKEKDTYDGYLYQLDWLAIAPMNLKVGLLNSLDLQLLIEPYNHVHEFEEDLSDTTQRGFGDLTLRLKYNLWGNDHGRTAGAVMPFVKFATSTEGVGSEVLEGGVILPFSAELPWGFQFGFTSRFGVMQDILGGTARHAEFGNSVELAHQLIGDLDGYVEYFANVSTENEVGWVSRFDFGFVYWLTEDLQLNTGLNTGLTKWADNWNVFFGFALRY